VQERTDDGTALEWLCTMPTALVAETHRFTRASLYALSGPAKSAYSS